MLILPGIEPSSRRVRRDDAGMTLPEVMVAILSGLVVMFAAYAAMQVATSGQVRVADRVDSVQRGRLGMERITRSLRQQSCLPTTSSGGIESGLRPALEIGTDQFVEFFASTAANPDSGSNTNKWALHRIEWQQVAAGSADFRDGGPATGNIIEKTYVSKDKVAPYTFPSNPTTVDVLAEGVQQQVDGAGTTVPIFRFYEYDPAQPGSVAASPLPFYNVSTASANNPNKRPKIADSERELVVVIDVAYAARPRHAKVAQSRTVPFTNRVSVRTADVYSSGASTCISN